MPGCDKHVHSFDHPSWQMFINATGASIIVGDQCPYLDREEDATKTETKAWVKCEFVYAKDPGGTPYAPVWRKPETLLPVPLCWLPYTDIYHTLSVDRSGFTPIPLGISIRAPLYL